MGQLEIFDSSKHSLQAALLVLEHGGGQLLLHQSNVVQQHRVMWGNVASLQDNNNSSTVSCGATRRAYKITTIAAPCHVGPRGEPTR